MDSTVFDVATRRRVPQLTGAAGAMFVHRDWSVLEWAAVIAIPTLTLLLLLAAAALAWALLRRAPGPRFQRERLRSVPDDEEASSPDKELVTLDGMIAAKFGASRLGFAKFWLVGTGVFWGLAMQLIYYEGGGHPLHLLPNVDWYVGMMLVYSGRCCRPRDTRFADAQQRHMFPIAVCDFIGTVGTTIGLLFAGSAIFGIIFASVTVWSAMFACCILHKKQTTLQLAGILTVMAGLSLPALDEHDAAADAEQALDEVGPMAAAPTLDDGGGVGDLGAAGADEADVGGSSQVQLGIMLTLAGTMFYALEYVLCERAFSVYDKPADAKQLCFWTGAWGLAFTAVWLVAVTIPQWSELVVAEVEAHDGRPWLIVLLYAGHTINNSIHNIAWFVVCELEGGVSTGLLMGVKAASLFFTSAAFFCSAEHPEQCLTTLKLCATIIVLVGTTLYYWPGPTFDSFGEFATWASAQCNGLLARCAGRGAEAALVSDDGAKRACVPDSMLNGGAHADTDSGGADSGGDDDDVGGAREARSPQQRGGSKVERARRGAAGERRTTRSSGPMERSALVAPQPDGPAVVDAELSS